MLEGLPSIKPNYANKNLSPYEGNYIESIGANAEDDLYHFAPLLIEQIKIHEDQEIGTHTFSHYYCLEAGQTLESFNADLEMAIAVAQKNNVQLTSLIFPRNQFNENYLKICSENGITCYRGNEHSWLYSAKNQEDESMWRRALRLLDAYINISGHNCYTDEYIASKTPPDEYIASKTPQDIPSSRFLRPYSNKLRFLDWLRLARIKSGMSHAAKNNLTYHLWWHPHNFGINQKENFAFLEQILQHYQKLNRQYGFNSYTMSNLAALLKND